MTEPDGLESIRTAYRYVAAYQRRLLDIVGTLDDALDEIGVGFRKWSQDDVRQGNDRIPSEGWGSDLLPLAYIRLRWSADRAEENKAGAAWFWMQHVADTMVESRLRRRGREPDWLDDLSQGRSVIRLYWVKLDEPFASDTWRHSWQDVLPAHFGVPEHELVPPLPTPSQPVAREKDGVSFGAMCVSTASLREPDDATTMLVEPAIAAFKRLLKGT